MKNRKKNILGLIQTDGTVALESESFRLGLLGDL